MHSWWYRFKFMLALLVATFPAFAVPVVTLTASPTSGTSPLSVTLTWTSTESSVCTASGGWTGTKAVNGTEVVSVVASATFTLTCNASTGSATITWNAPTTNTDNSPIPATGPTALAGFEVLHAATAAGVSTATPVVLNNPAQRSYVITGLPVGTRYYAMTAFNVSGTRSSLSSQDSNTIVLPSGSASASVTVTVQPRPPVIVTVSQTAYEVVQHPSGPRLARDIGHIALGVECSALPVIEQGGIAYHTVPIAAVDLYRKPNAKTIAVVVSCALTG